MNKSCSNVNWPKQKKNMGYRLFSCCLIITIFTAWNAFNICPTPLKLFAKERRPMDVHFEEPGTHWASTPMDIDLEEPDETRQTLLLGVDCDEPHEYVEFRQFCNLTHPRSDVCDLSGDIRIHGDTSTIYDVGFMNNSWKIKPYPRKGDDFAMGKVKTITINVTRFSDSIPKCSTRYNVPAIVFSTGGYTKNYFHGFTDVLIPLFSTSMEFNGEVQFIVTDQKPSWTDKFKHLLRKLSKYEIIDIDSQRDQVLCFSRIIVGLKANKEFSIDSSTSRYSIRDFTNLLKNTYSLKQKNVKRRKKPRVLIISRNKTRKLLNVKMVASMAEELGFNVVINETSSDVRKTSKFVNSFDVLMGVHGSGLSNMVFLPENAVVIQIIPFGINKWLARFDFKEAAVDMNLRYLDYKICPNESSLIQIYPYDHKVFKEGSSEFDLKEWNSSNETYVRAQGVNLDLGRFKEILLQARKLLRA